jgi:hypothetical protein
VRLLPAGSCAHRDGRLELERLTRAPVVTAARRELAINQFSGSIPPSFSSLTALQYLCVMQTPSACALRGACRQLCRNMARPVVPLPNVQRLVNAFSCRCSLTFAMQDAGQQPT